MAKASGKDDPNSKTICTNRRARHEYDLLNDLECGIELRGSEVKSLRNGKASLEDAYARVRQGELWLIGCDIPQYPQASLMNHEPKRDRKLLVHTRELHKFAEGANQRGFTLVPLSMYFRNGRVKVKIAIAKGKQLHDKREKLKQDTARKDIERAMRQRR